MDRIKKLIVKAHNIVTAGAERLYIAFVSKDWMKGAYIVDGRVWNEKRGTSRRVTYACLTEKEAFQRLDSLAAQYPPKKDFVVITGADELSD